MAGSVQTSCRMIGIVTAGAGLSAATLEAKTDTYLTMSPRRATLIWPQLSYSISGRGVRVGKPHSEFTQDYMTLSAYSEWCNLAGGTNALGPYSQSVYVRLLNDDGLWYWYTGEAQRPDADGEGATRTNVKMIVNNLLLVGGGYSV